MQNITFRNRVVRIRNEVFLFEGSRNIGENDLATRMFCLSTAACTSIKVTDYGYGEWNGEVSSCGCESTEDSVWTGTLSRIIAFPGIPFLRHGNSSIFIFTRTTSVS